MNAGHALDVQVLVVGAGPTGLTAACLLRELGVSALVVDTRAGTTTRSKALVLQARTLELFEKIGIADAAVEHGEPLRWMMPVVRGKVRGRVDISQLGTGLTRYPYLLSLEQSRTEELLHRALLQRGGQVQWSTTLVSFQQDQQGVTAVLSKAGGLAAPAAERAAEPAAEPAAGPTRVRCQYILAADGAHSTVRHALGIPFQGATYQHQFVLADVAAPDLPQQSLSLFLSWNGFAAFFSMKGGNRARAISMMPGEAAAAHPAADADDQPPFALVVQAVQRSAGSAVRMEDPRWCSVYRLHHRAAASLHQGRAFLLGDAAHIHSPAGGQGMNTGIQDAFNLCWRVAAVLQRGASPSLLETYNAERHPVALALLHGTDRVFSMATSTALPARVLRACVLPYVLPWVFRMKSFRRKVFRRVSQIAVRYRHSPLSQDVRGGKRVCAGARLPWVDTPAGEALRAAQAGLHGLVVVLEGQAGAQEFAPLLARWAPWLRLHVVPRTAPGAEPLFQACGVGEEGALLVVRPDGYLGFVGTMAQRDALCAYLEKWFPTAASAGAK